MRDALTHSSPFNTGFYPKESVNTIVLFVRCKFVKSLALHKLNHQLSFSIALRCTKKEEISYKQYILYNKIS